MKSLMRILLGGLLVFIAVALVQEWDFFASSWFGDEESAPTLSEGEQEAAVQAVRQTLTLMGHLYSSGGDERFVERMPASESVRAEMLADVRYVKINHRRQEPILQRLEVFSVDVRTDKFVEVRTREFWIHNTYWVIGGTEAEPPRSQIVLGRYLVVKPSQTWQVEGWDFAVEAPAETSLRGG